MFVSFFTAYLQSPTYPNARPSVLAVYRVPRPYITITVRTRFRRISRYEKNRKDSKRYRLTAEQHAKLLDYDRVAERLIFSQRHSTART